MKPNPPAGNPPPDSRFGALDGRGSTAKGGVVRNFPTAEQDLEQAKQMPRYGGDDSSYALAFDDDPFMLRDELRPVRMQMELLKPELIQREEGIDATIVIFGSARILPAEDAAKRLEDARRINDPQAIRRATTGMELSRYYEEARRFAAIVTRESQHYPDRVVICTGGGPGIMEAGNRGAMEAGGKSVGLNIVIPHEQEPNPYITPKLCFLFHYFGLRKMHFLMRAMGLVCFPGGFGTLDELFEVLTLTQTGKVRKRPIVLVGREFWDKLVNWNWLVDTGMIAPEDLKLFTVVDTAEDAWAVLMHALGYDDPESTTGAFAVDI
jgi:uncharacterized protein (TIGR00730 family)